MGFYPVAVEWANTELSPAGILCAPRALGYTYAGSLVESEMTVPVRVFSFDG
jgi:hypothetical protein